VPVKACPFGGLRATPERSRRGRVPGVLAFSLNPVVCSSYPQCLLCALCASAVKPPPACKFHAKGSRRPIRIEATPYNTRCFEVSSRSPRGHSRFFRGKLGHFEGQKRAVWPFFAPQRPKKPLWRVTNAVRPPKKRSNSEVPSQNNFLEFLAARRKPARAQSQRDPTTNKDKLGD